jgi:transposase
VVTGVQTCALPIYKKLYLSNWYWRLKQRTDARRAIVALARKLLVIIYVMLKSKSAYDEQKFLQRKEVTDKKHVTRLIHELNGLGYSVSLAA